MTAKNTNAQTEEISDTDLDVVAGGGGSGKATQLYPFAHRFLGTSNAWKPGATAV